MAQEIHKSKVIQALHPRREPYWGAPLARGGYWASERCNETGHKVYRALGYLTERFDFENAREAAQT
jgi:hypothetical protein